MIPDSREPITGEEMMTVEKNVERKEVGDMGRKINSKNNRIRSKVKDNLKGEKKEGEEEEAAEGEKCEE